MMEGQARQKQWIRRIALWLLIGLVFLPLALLALWLFLSPFSRLGFRGAEIFSFLFLTVLYVRWAWHAWAYVREIWQRPRYPRVERVLHVLSGIGAILVMIISIIMLLTAYPDLQEESNRLLVRYRNLAILFAATCACLGDLLLVRSGYPLSGRQRLLLYFRALSEAVMGVGALIIIVATFRNFGAWEPVTGMGIGLFAIGLAGWCLVWVGVEQAARRRKRRQRKLEKKIARDFAPSQPIADDLTSASNEGPLSAG